MINCGTKFKLSLLVIALGITGPSLSEELSTQGYITNVPHITEAKLSANYWLDKIQDRHAVLMSEKRIDSLNKSQFQRGTYLRSPLSFDESISGEQLKTFITEISKQPSTKRYYPNGEELTAQHFEPYIANTNLSTIKTSNVVKFALVTQRSSLRTFPTLDRVLNQGMVYDLDRFQETAVFPGETLAVLHTSADGNWAFVQNYHYRAWVQLKDIAFADKATISNFNQQPNKLIITGAKEHTVFNPKNSKTSEIQLDMGVALPIISFKDYGTFELNDHNPYMHHLVQLPTRDEQGNLKLEATLIARSADTSVGYLPMTKENIVKQAFKFLGERYGWGHDFNGRDCTGFVGEIFKTFGLLLPRNSGQQGKDPVGENIRFEKGTPIEAKLPHVDSMDVGDLIYLPGHVAMVLGYDNGKPFLIHDVHGMSYQSEHNGERVQGILNGVSITPLIPFKSYLRSMYNIKRIR